MSSSSVDVGVGCSSLRRGIFPTARGWAAVLAIVSLTVAVAVVPSAPLVALDAALGVALLAAIVGLRSSRSRSEPLRAVLSGPSYIPRGKEAVLELVVAGNLPAWGCSIEVDPLSARWTRGTRELRTSSWISGHLVAPPARHRVSVGEGVVNQLLEFQVPTSKRGQYRCRGVTLWLGDPLGLFGARLAQFSALTSVVHPMVLPMPSVTPDPATRQRNDREAAGHVPKRFGVDVLGVRPYEQGDRLSLLHWRSVLGVGPLLVREFADETAEPLQIILDDRAWVHRRAPFERTLDLMAGTLATRRPAGQHVRLRSLTSGHAMEIPTGLTPALLDWLAAVEPRQSDEPLPNSDAQFLSIGPGDMVFTTVTASRSLRSLEKRGAALVVAG